MLRPIRRVVTGLDPNGKATVIFDDAAEHILEFLPGSGSTELWASDESPVDLDVQGDRARPMVHDPRPNGTLFRLIELAPARADTRSKSDAIADSKRIQQVMNSARPSTDEELAAHPTMHRTDSLDYLVIISGRLTMIMEDGTEVELYPGDCVVQQATLHAWENRGDESCLMAAVLVDARPAERAKVAAGAAHAAGT
jgi:mannose-6-phosphate isomerase-like protein (cupin superfamily)